MTTPPDHDELRIRGRLLEHIDGVPVQLAARPRDWLDDVLDAPTETRPPDPPQPPTKQAPTADPGEPRWDWQRLRHWPYARLCVGAAVALIPWYRGQSAALTWGHVLEQARAQASVGGAYVIAAIGLTVGAVWVHRRRSWIGWCLLTSAFIGTVAMASPTDIITFITGAAR